jgi:hypothetical protein
MAMRHEKIPYPGYGKRKGEHLRSVWFRHSVEQKLFASFLLIRKPNPKKSYQWAVAALGFNRLSKQLETLGRHRFPKVIGSFQGRE